MGDKRNYAALDWVIGEIGETLKDARQSLESYVEDPRDTARIRFCLTHIHQVHGSLQMVEFHGASLFAEEMELLTTAIMNGQVINEQEAHEALMRSLLQLPLYLEQVKSLHEDHPAVVLPLLNDLRAVRKESYLSETNLFNPDLSSLSQIRGERHPILQDQAKLKQVVHKLREMYQYAAASVLRGIKIDENLGYVEKVVSRLEGITRGTACYPTWQVSAALVEALARDDVELSIAVRGLMRSLARELKVLEEHCPAALDNPAREPLLRNLLYYVARAEENGPRVKQVRRQYGLENAILGGGSSRLQLGKGPVSPPAPEAVKAVVLALQEELNTCKHLLDLAVSGQGGMSDLEEMLPYVKRISDTLAVLGIGELRKQTQEQLEALTGMCKAGGYTEAALIDVANGLANIEHRLEAIGKGASKNRDYANVDEREVEVDAAKDALLEQCRAGLETVKNAIVESMAGQWNPDHLPPAVETLHYVYGALRMVPLPRPAHVLDTCGEFIQARLLAANTTPVEELQTLAEAIASIDYFLERLQGGHGDDLDIYLDMAEASLAQLGYSSPGAAADEAEAVVDDEQDQNADEPASVAEADTAAPADEEYAAAPLEPSIDLPAPSDSELADAFEPSIAEVEPDPLAEDSVELPAQEAHGEPEAQVEEDDIDEEIIEIFIEEADEVLQTLNEYLPKWQNNLDDDDSLGVIRRAFHTLKGSGRMVQAYDVGELAWAVENMLNRVLDRSVTAEEVHVRLMEQVVEFVPSLIEAFSKRQRNPDPETHARYISWAEQMAQGHVPEALRGSGSYQDVTPAEVEEPLELEDVLVEDDNDEQALWEIFASEANTHLQVIDEYIVDEDAAAPLYTMPTDDLQRALHTLKGSAHMAAVTPIATMISPLEGFVKELRGYQLRIDEDILQLLKDASSYTRDGLECIDRQEPIVLPKLEQFLARVDELYDRYIAPLIHMRELGAMEGQSVDPTMLTSFMSAEMSLLLEADRLVRQWQNDGAIAPQVVVELYAELRQLHDVAAQANALELQQLAEVLAKVYAAVDAGQLELSHSAFDTLAAAHEFMLDMFDQVAAAMTVQPASAELLEQLQSLVPAENEAADGETDVSAFDAEQTEPATEGSDVEDAGASEAEEGFAAHQGYFSEDEQGSAEQETTEHETFEQGTIATPEPADDSAESGPDSFAEQNVYAYDSGEDEYGSDELSFAEQDINSDEPAQSRADEQPMQDVEHFAVGETEQSEEPEESDELRADAVAEHEQSNAWEILPAGEEDPTGEEESTFAEQDTAAEHDTADASAPADTEQTFAEQDTTADESQSLADNLADDIAAETSDWENDFAPSADAADEPARRDPDVGHIEEDDFDPDILEIFLEEAGELIEELDEAIHRWESDQDDTDAAETMKRALHTLKGGARLSGLKNLGELTHDYESYLITTGGPRADANFFPAIHAYQDNVLTGVRAVRARLNGEPAPEASAPPPPPPARIDEVEGAAEADASAAIIPFGRRDEAPEVDEDGGFVQPAPKPKTAVASSSNKRQGSQEMIKVSADLLEELVNLAGETSISRGRLEQQVSDLSSAVDEVDATLRRLNEQLRRLDMETDAQVSFRQEQMAAHEGFDPLEMDRYSQLQQLTRSLMESASDLGDLKITLSDKIKDTETLLLQQSRINSALQEGLMRSRMVPFSRLVPRLRRIVRQVSGELGKHVNFELDNVEGEMDRSVLERMVAPLEHMLRNAVDHGIEMPDDRVQQGKPETGRILLSLAREGGDILLRMADDGRGINLERVREKAIERGLMAADAELSDHDVMQFILQAGFSTAENVTQISGRGVGMDVVAAEIKQLGGSIVIDSRTGAGTQFTVRLPFTVSVNRALMVQLGTEMFAIPLNTIEGIVRVSPFELEHYYNHPDARFEYAGENYQVRHLGAMLSHEMQPKLDGQLLPLPVILVRTTQHTMALQVDGLMGSREIVVKSLGPQFAAVQGLSGATVMGDGSVVVIIDPHALVRREVAQSALPAPPKTLQAPVELAPELKTIMVVDDSVTVRKVTTRFLEREGYNVVTAKDGVDALQLLQEEVPDLMLLDIEMPRMDGFEVAKNIRSTRRLKHLPIIMITSRTGDKHRQHALSIGVDDYMGKPYQEEALLRTMQSLLAKRSASA